MRVLGFERITFRDFAARLWRRYGEVAVSDSAAQLAYYLLFSIFPLLFFLVSLLAFLPLRGAVDELMSRAREVVPEQALAIVQDRLTQLVTNPRPRLLALGAAIALWSASRGVDSMRTAMNRSYEVSESRPFWKAQGTSIAVTVAGTLLVLLSFAVIILGGKAGIWVAEQLSMKSEFVLVWGWLRWPITALVIMLAVALAYYALPDVKQEFRFITPGSVLATLVWLVATWGFTFYSEHFSAVGVTYGSIGGVILLLTWFYLSGFIFVLGGLINAILEHASKEGKEPGARRAGEPAPPEAVRLAAETVGAGKAQSVAKRTRRRFGLFRRRRTT